MPCSCGVTIAYYRTGGKCGELSVCAMLRIAKGTSCCVQRPTKTQGIARAHTLRCPTPPMRAANCLRWGTHSCPPYLSLPKKMGMSATCEAEATHQLPGFPGVQQHARTQVAVWRRRGTASSCPGFRASQHEARRARAVPQDMRATHRNGGVHCSCLEDHAAVLAHSRDVARTAACRGRQQSRARRYRW